MQGEDVERFIMRRGHVDLEVIALGCAITRLEVPDRNGQRDNVVLGYANLADYASRDEYFGVTVGRVANRMAHGRFVLDGRAYQLTRNHGRHHLHGGNAGFDKKIWRLVDMDDGPAARLRFQWLSPDGDEGYPGDLVATTTYTLHESGELRIEFEASTDAPTVVNMTNHTYFNLGGAGRGDVLDHDLAIAAAEFCAVDEELIPTGELRSVAGTPFDFRDATAIGLRIADADVQLRHAHGYDHCMVLQRAGGEVRDACVLTDRSNGRRLSLRTDQPGLQLYSGNFLDGTARGPGGIRYGKHDGVCLETQGFPDAPNHPNFPPVVLLPGARYRTETVWRFDVLP